MKTFKFILGTLAGMTLISFSAHAEEFKCKATRIMDASFYGETFSVEKSPEVELSASGIDYTLRIGRNNLEVSRVEALPASGFDQGYRIEVVKEGATQVIEFSTSGASGEEGLLGVDGKLVARLSCK